MISKKKLQPTDGEMEILQILWNSGPSTVKEVNQHLSRDKEVGYTTTLKFMQIMNEKSLVSRKKNGKSHTYSATVSEGDAQKQVIDKILDTVFHGSAMKLVMQALGNSKSSQKEIDEIKRYLDSFEASHLDEKGGKR